MNRRGVGLERGWWLGLAWGVMVLSSCGSATDLDRGAHAQAGSGASGVDAADMDGARPDAGALDARADVGTLDAAQDGAHVDLDAAIDAGVDAGDADVCDGGVLVDDECVFPSVTRVEFARSDLTDLFGAAVALSDNTLVVGAPGESGGATMIDGDLTDNSAPSSGAVYVYIRQGSGWALQAYLKPADNAADARFGSSVAISGDLVVVGAPGASQARAAYVFERVGTTWNQVAALVPASWSWEYGGSVAVSGDTVVVGAPNHEGIGAAHVFTRGAGAWFAQAVLRSSRNHPYDRFGGSVAIDGDLIVVGAPGDDSDALGINGDEGNHLATDSGAAHVFVRNGEAWTQQAYLKRSAEPLCFRCELQPAGFGGDVAIHGSVVAIGAPNELSNAIGVNDMGDRGNPLGSGSVYLFATDGSDWSQFAYVRAQDPEAADAFGTSVALSDRRVVIGAWNSAGAEDRAFSFERQNGRVTQRRSLRAPTDQPNPGQGYGLSTAVSGHTIAVGDWDYEMDRGAVYVFEDP